MNVRQLIDEVDRQVPVSAPPGTRCKLMATVTTPHGPHRVAAAARIDARGRRREQYWCDGVRLERAVLLRLTCPETECPHAVQVRAQWLDFHRQRPAKTAPQPPRPLPLIAEVAVTVGRQQLVARPARFPCFTPCPQGAHPPLTIDKSGFDLFEDGTCLGGGAVESGGFMRPRLPTLRAAEAFVLARHLEALAALEQASRSSRPGGGRGTEGGDGD